MEFLEEIYENSLIDMKGFQRKLPLSNKKTIIQSPPFCGTKEYLIHKILEKELPFIFIDLEDFRAKNITADNLNLFVKEKNIEIVCIKNYKKEFGEVFGNEVYLISHEKIELNGFENINLLPLDFEEFISLSDKIKKTEDLFNEFFKHGSLPQMINLKENQRIERAGELINLLFKNETRREIFNFLVLKTGFAYSLFQAFNLIKNEIRLSKDLFYKTIEEYEDKQYIFTVEKFGSPKAPKKFYPYDFVFKQALTHKKDLGKNFEHIIFLELRKSYSKIYYMDFIDFYIESKNLAVLSLPFLNYEQLLVKSMAVLRTQRVDSIDIVTLGFEYVGEVHGVIVTAKPFWDWALGE